MKKVFQKGRVKTGGRKAGTKNVVQTVRSIVEEQGFDVIGGLLKNIQELEKPPTSASAMEFLAVQKLWTERYRIASELRLQLSEFMFPKPKIEVGLDVKSFSDDDLIEEAKRRLESGS